MKPTEGKIELHQEIRVTIREMKDWPPEEIASFFSGIAQMIRAKRGLEPLGTPYRTGEKR